MRHVFLTSITFVKNICTDDSFVPYNIMVIDINLKKREIIKPLITTPIVNKTRERGMIFF